MTREDCIRDIKTEFVNSNDLLANIFTKSLKRPRINYICNKFEHKIYMHQFEGEC